MENGHLVLVLVETWRLLVINNVMMSEKNAHNIIKKRIVAAIIDIYLCLIFIGFLASILNNPIILIIYPLNYVVFPHYKGYSIGMFLMRIRIVTVHSENTRPKISLLLARTVYFYTIYLYENILTRGIVKINQLGQTKLDQKFNTTIVFKDSVWNENASEYTYESYLFYVIMLGILFLFFALLIFFELINHFFAILN